MTTMKDLENQIAQLRAKLEEKPLDKFATKTDFPNRTMHYESDKVEEGNKP